MWLTYAPWGELTEEEDEKEEKEEEKIEDEEEEKEEEKIEDEEDEEDIEEEAGILHMSRDMTKSTKWLCAQQRLRSVWASAQSDQSLCCVLNG